MINAPNILRIPAVMMFFIATFAYGQQKPVLSQYMYSGLVLNPAYAGVHEYTTFTAMYRDQWINVPGAPTLTTFTAQTGIKDRNIGTGLMISDDKIGVHSNLAMYGSYAYNVRLQNGAKFSMGLQGGVDVLRSNWSELVLDDINDPILSGSETNYFPNFGTGVFYSSESIYMGLSVPYILTSRKTEKDDFFRDVRHSRNYYITAGYLFDLGFKFKMKPSFLLRLEDNMPLAFDLNTNFIYDDMIDIGFSYRSGDSFISILGLQVNNYLKFSYAYDYVLSSLTTYTKGSHELMLQYRINFNAPKRHRMCPQPMYF
jgi:type IX secretion system PorP/SprF family membrane protein